MSVPELAIIDFLRVGLSAVLVYRCVRFESFSSGLASCRSD